MTATAASRTAPKPIVISFWLWVVSAVLSVLGSITGLIALNPLSFIFVIVTIVAIVQMYVPAAREYFAANKR